MKDYLELRVRSRAAPTPPDVYPWEEELAVYYAESILDLQAYSSAWRETVREMVHQHQDFLREYGLNCGTVERGFPELVGDVLNVEATAVCRDGRSE